MSGEMVPPQYSPSDTTSARSPLAVLLCSAPPLGCGSVHVLDGSFARFCVSENARVPLRYSGQPLRRKINASRSPNTPWFCLSNRFFASFNQAIDRKSIYADIRQPKNYASNRNGHIRITDAPVSHTRYFWFSPGYPLPTRHFLFRARFAARLSTRLEQIFCVLLRLSERSGTIEVHLATLSA